jgi:hypothetical protein
MPESNLEPVNLGSITNGALMRLFELEIQKIANNIADRSTSATAKRSLVLKLDFKPDIERRGISVTTSAKTTLASVESHASRLYAGKGTDGQVYLFDEDPRQELLFSAPAEDPNLIDFQRAAAGQNAG